MRLSQNLLSLAVGCSLLLNAAVALAGQMTPGELYGYKTYLRVRPPKDKPVKYNLYPFAGPVIKFGQDIPLCDAARKAETYDNKTELKYLLHGREGWLFRTIDFRTDFTAKPPAMDLFRRLDKALADKGETLVVAFQPTRAMMSAEHLDPRDTPEGYSPAKARQGYMAFLKQLNDAKIVAPDLSEPSKNVAYFPKGDFHWSPAGARDAAVKIAEAVKDLAAYGDVDNQEFDSVTDGYGPADRGAFEEFIQNTCKVNIELTSEPLWKTVSEGSSSGDPLADTPPPAITLLGTSNSSEDQKFNFAGSLRHYLEADIYNAAILGGGFGSSPTRYFASEEYHAHPPKIVVWEFLPQHNYNNAESLASLRQMVPAVYGVCTEKTALSHFRGSISAEKTDVFQDYKKPLKGSYLYIDAQDPVERDLKIEILYANGEADQVDLTRSTRAPNNGKYFLELGSGDAAPLSFKIVTSQPRGSVEARLCSYPVDVASR